MVVGRGSKGKEMGRKGLGEQVEREVPGKSTEDLGSGEARRKGRVRQCKKAFVREKGMGVGEDSSCEGGKGGEMEMFRGGRKGERQMNRQITTNAIISRYSSNLIVTPPQKKMMRQGVCE